MTRPPVLQKNVVKEYLICNAEKREQTEWHAVSKSFGTALLFAAFDPSTLVIGRKPFLGHLPACRLAVVSLLRRWRSAAELCPLVDFSPVSFFFLFFSFFRKGLSTVAYLHGPPAFCTKSQLSVCQSSCPLWLVRTTAWSRAEQP